MNENNPPMMLPNGHVYGEMVSYVGIQRWPVTKYSDFLEYSIRIYLLVLLTQEAMFLDYLYFYLTLF